MGKRIFITSCSGFLLRNILPLFESDNQVTLLYFAKNVEEGKYFLNNLLHHLNIKNISSRNYRIIIGDLLKPSCGINDLSEIDSDFWLIGTIPFKFGQVNEKSTNSARTFIQNISQTILEYHKNIEKIKHCVFISSAYIFDSEYKHLPENLIENDFCFGNFDCCKKTIEKKLVETIISTNFPKSSIIRADLGLSAISNQVGGIINVICEKLSTVGFNKLALLKNTKIKFVDVHQLNNAFKSILLTEPTKELNFFNAFDKYTNITLYDFISIFNSITGKNIEILDTELFSDDLSYTDKMVNDFLHEKLGFYLLDKFNAVNVETIKIEEKIGFPWVYSTPENKITIMSKVVLNSFLNDFKTNNINLGLMPIY